MKMLERRLSVIGLIFLVLVIFPSQNVLAQSKVINLKFANFFPPLAQQSKICEDFIAELEKRTDGRVKVRYFPGGSLLKATTMYNGIENGIADIGLSHIEYTPGRFPVLEAAELPLGFPSGWSVVEIVNDFYNTFKPKEFDSVKVLWLHANSPAILVTKTPVRTLEDLKGLIIRAPGRQGTVIRALGGVPAPTPMMEVYDALAKNVVQGTLGGGEVVKTFRFGEVAKYATMCWHVGCSIPFYVVMNKKSYAQLPPDIKEILDFLCGEYKERFALMWNASDFGGMAFGKKLGVEYIDLSKDEFDRWEKATLPVIEDYVNDMVKKGFAESEVRGWITYLRERKDYVTKKQLQLEIKSESGPSEMRP